MNKPFFSIITCTRNSSAYVQQNIASVASQTFKDYEHIFIDGKSNDETQEIIQKRVAQSPENTLFYSLEPKGISSAMNEGIRQARGSYVIHLHSDDSFYDENVLQNIFLFLQKNNNPDWIYGQICTRRDENIIGIFPRKDIWQVKENSAFKKYLLRFYNFVPHQAVFIKKETFAQHGYFDESLRCHMDLDMWLRIQAKTRWLYAPFIISNYALRFDAQSSGAQNQKANDVEERKVLHSHLDFFEIITYKLFSVVIYIYKLCKKK